QMSGNCVSLEHEYRTRPRIGDPIRWASKERLNPRPDCTQVHGEDFRLIKKRLLLGGLVGLLLTLSFAAAGYVAPDNTDPLFLLSFYVLIMLPTRIIYGLFGWRWNIESGPQNNSLRTFLSALFVNSFLLALLFGAITYGVLRIKSLRGGTGKDVARG
ncbi:MAG: hypothetical protein NT154_08230, partial [Verrucomicrobia bacterium]|nr:hypothetical protein [Verrucomicrobiota bacterium]